MFFRAGIRVWFCYKGRIAGPSQEKGICMFRKRLLASVLALTFSTSTLASIQSEMQSWFNEMGAYGNVTGAQIVKGQTTAVYTGGSMYMRTPIRNYQLASISPPSVRGGCGGIDLFAGSFSFINSEQLTALLRNTANNAIGYAFMMAVKSISPDLADLLQYLQDQASKINGMNLNSCQMAEGITTATLGPLLSDKKEQANAQGTGSLLSNLWSDSFQSFDEWRQSKSAKKQARQQAANADANLKEILEPGNVVWKALQKTGTPDELKELMMSMVGTIIIIPPGDTGNENGEKPLWRYVGPTGVKFADFVGNPESATKSDITLLKCGNDSDCMTPSATPNQSVASLSWHVRQTMEKATDNIQNRQGQTFTGIDYAVYLNSSVPVWRLVNVAAMNRGGPALLTNNYAQTVAVELAYNWFSEMVRTLQKALSNNASAQSQDIVQASASLNEQIASVKSLAASEYIAKYQQAVSMAELQKTTQWLHETMMRALPVDVQKSLMAFNR
jgi:conjugative transfer pilus assembly protein TraH